MRSSELRPITKAEWDKFDWINATAVGESGKVFLRGVEHSSPPDDGFVYADATRPGDAIQRWERAMTYAQEGAGV